VALAPIKTRSSPLQPARIAFVAEAPGKDEDAAERFWVQQPELARQSHTRRGPLIGSSGVEFDSWLMEIGVDRRDVFITNVCKYRPPGNDMSEFFLDDKMTKPNDLVIEGLRELAQELAYVRPTIVVAMGNTALWALTNVIKGAKAGIGSWRGSILQNATVFGAIAPFDGPAFKVIPTYHPAAIGRMYAWRNIALQDLRRMKVELGRGPKVILPPWRFMVRPTFDQTMSTLKMLHDKAEVGNVPLVADIETPSGHLDCIGLAWSKLDAICIPFLDTLGEGNSYWTVEQERAVVTALRALLSHRNVWLVGQNFLYDLQHICREWGIAPTVHFDTMVAQHSLLPGTPKKLEYLSSMYCDFHQYWKDEGKKFRIGKDDFEQLWSYNCRDLVSTFEIYEAQRDCLDQMQRWSAFSFLMYDLYPALFGMMLRGTPFDKSLRGKLFGEVTKHMEDRQRLLNTLVGRPVNPRSPKQLMDLFYGEFGQKRIISMKTHNPTCDEDALKQIAKREPILRPVCGAINEFRSLSSALGVIMQGVDTDGHMRTSYGFAETMRLTSSENAFGGGGNLQNITEGGKSEWTGLEIPNLRRLLIPPKDHVIADGDGQKADLYVVVWEAEDDELKTALRKNMDMHLVNVRAVYNIDIPDDELIDGTEVCEEHKKRYANQRRNCKNGIHATNYGARPPKLAKLLGSTVHEADMFQRKYFGGHPGILRWHERVMHQINTTRSVTSMFGFVRHYFDRIEDCFTEALAWLPQHTVAMVTNKSLVSIDRQMKPKVLVRLQTHDSLTLTYHKSIHPHVLKEILPLTRIVVPYDDPLVIPFNFKASDKSWGECKSVGTLTAG
jgi:uracil-DNA glycosylase